MNITELDIKNLTKQQIQNLIRKPIKQFDEFTDNLAKMSMPEFAPPFESYASFNGDIISYLGDFYKRYKDAIKEIKCFEQVNMMMEHLVNSYRSSIGNMTPSPKFNLLNETESLCDVILKTLTAYFHGSPAKAFDILNSEMTKSDCHLLNIIPQIHMVNAGSPMYRVRKGGYDDWKDLFHVPYDKRDKCSSYRFSIAGVPALYCGASLKTAILECRIEPDSEVSAACFEFRRGKDYPFIDLTFSGKRDYSIWERYGLLLFYPLIVACGLKVRKPDSPFKPEYIIPQLFYQIMRSVSDAFYGIAYNSGRYAHRDFTDISQTNYVVFVRDCEKEKGYSENLASQLEIQGPLQFVYHSDSDIVETQRYLLSAPKSALD